MEFSIEMVTRIAPLIVFQYASATCEFTVGVHGGIPRPRVITRIIIRHRAIQTCIEIPQPAGKEREGLPNMGIVIGAHGFAKIVDVGIPGIAPPIN